MKQAIREAKAEARIPPSLKSASGLRVLSCPIRDTDIFPGFCAEDGVQLAEMRPLEQGRRKARNLAADGRVDKVLFDKPGWRNWQTQRT
jgi:hypothetical protein